jgi:hypothetical protein
LEELHILPTDKTPEVILYPAGVLKIKGRSLIINTTQVPVQIMNWIGEYLRDPAEVTEVLVALEYLNSFGTTILVSILVEISKVVLSKKNIVFKWYYEEGDDDIAERGEYISSVYKIPIEFIMTRNLADV